MQVIQGKHGGLIKAWIDGVQVEEQARAHCWRYWTTKRQRSS
jgi:hypothetical protein